MIKSDKQKKKDNVYKWRKNNPDRYREYMKEHMRKRRSIKSNEYINHNI